MSKKTEFSFVANALNFTQMSKLLLFPTISVACGISTPGRWSIVATV